MPVFVVDLALSYVGCDVGPAVVVHLAQPDCLTTSMRKSPGKLLSVGTSDCKNSGGSSCMCVGAVCRLSFTLYRCWLWVSVNAV